MRQDSNQQVIVIMPATREWSSKLLRVSPLESHYPDNIKHDNFCVYEEYRNI